MCERTDGATGTGSAAATAAMNGVALSLDSGDSVSLVVALPSGTKFTVTLPQGSTIETTSVLDVKELLATLEEAQNCSVESQRLMHKGRILDNDRTLAEYGILNNSTLFLVKLSSAAVAATVIKTPAVNTTATTTPASSVEGIDDDDDNFGIPIMPEVDDDDGIPIVPPHMMFPGDSAQVDSYNDNMYGAFPEGGFDPASLLSNPAIMGMMQSVVNNNPDMIRNLIQQQIESNPAIQEMMESNPAVGQMLSDPGQIDEMMRMMQNPDAMQHAMRSQDLALSQIENMPGGFAALTNMYETMQRPLEDGFADSNNNNSAIEGPPANSTETATDGATGAAMPNPWNTSSTRSASDSSLPAMANNPLASIMAGGANPDAIASMLGGNVGGAGGADQLSSLISSFTGGAGPSGYGGMPPNTSSMISQMMNPDNMNRVMQMGDQLRGAQTNNTSASGVNPWAGTGDNNAANPGAAVRTTSGGTSAPGLDVNSLLQGLAPHLRGGVGAAGSASSSGSSATSPPQPGLDFSSLLQGLAPHLRGGPAPTGANSSSATTSGTSGSASSRPVTLNVSNLLQGLAPHLRASMAAAAANNAAAGTGVAAANSVSTTATPADRYRVQLKALNGMGFDNEQQNIAALNATNGNLNTAVDMLLLGDVPESAAAVSSEDASSGDTTNEPTAPPSEKPQNE